MKLKITLPALLLLSVLMVSYATSVETDSEGPQTQQARNPWAETLLLGAIGAGLGSRKRRKELEQKVQSAQIRWQLVNKTNLDNFRGTYGQFFLRKAPAKSSNIDPLAQDTRSEFTRVEITSIQKDYLYLTDASFPPIYLKEEGEDWTITHQDGIGIKTVFQIIRLDFEHIDFIHWDENENWDKPQIFCKFGKNGKLPASRILYAEKVHNGERFIYRCICDQKDLIGANSSS